MPIPTPTPNPSDRQDEYERLQSLTLEELAEEVRAHNAKLEMEQATTPTPIPQDGRYTMFIDQKYGNYVGKIVRFKIGDSYAAETAI